jgi:hypothetical protein
MGLMFEVAEGGFLDIDVRIEGPDGKIVHQVRTLNFEFNSKDLFRRAVLTIFVHYFMVTYNFQKTTTVKILESDI